MPRHENEGRSRFFGTGHAVARSLPGVVQAVQPVQPLRIDVDLGSKQPAEQTCQQKAQQAQAVGSLVGGNLLEQSSLRPLLLPLLLPPLSQLLLRRLTLLLLLLLLLPPDELQRERQQLALPMDRARGEVARAHDEEQVATACRP